MDLEAQKHGVEGSPAQKDIPSVCLRMNVLLGIMFDNLGYLGLHLEESVFS